MGTRYSIRGESGATRNEMTDPFCRSCIARPVATPVFLVTFKDDSPIVLHQLLEGEYEIYLSYVGSGELEIPRTKFSVWPAEVTYVGTFAASVGDRQHGPMSS